MLTFILDLAIAIGIHHLNDLLHHVVRIFHGYGHEYQQSARPRLRDQNGMLTVIDFLETLLQSFQVKLPLMLEVQLLPQLFDTGIPLILGLGQLHLDLGDHVRELHHQCS